MVMRYVWKCHLSISFTPGMAFTHVRAGRREILIMALFQWVLPWSCAWRLTGGHCWCYYLHIWSPCYNHWGCFMWGIFLDALYCWWVFYRQVRHSSMSIRYFRDGLFWLFFFAVVDGVVFILFVFQRLLIVWHAHKTIPRLLSCNCNYHCNHLDGISFTSLCMDKITAHAHCFISACTAIAH